MKKQTNCLTWAVEASVSKYWLIDDLIFMSELQTTPTHARPTTPACAQYCKTFYGCNLQMFLIGQCLLLAGLFSLG